MITYEYPFNERIRTLLRLEDLFEKAAYFIQADGRLEHHAALATLFEILETAGRADLKMDLLRNWSGSARPCCRFATTRKFPKKRSLAPCMKSNNPRPHYWPPTARSASTYATTTG